MRTAVITFPGSNCDDDAVYAIHKCTGAQVDRIWHKDSASFSGYDLVVLPGGFSYGDYLRCGAIASLSAVMRSVKEYAQSGGWVVGICNGFQILCESGLLPGALTLNANQKFICRDVALAVDQDATVWSSGWKRGQTIRLPIAHGDGRYWVDPQGLEQLKTRGQIVFRYLDNPNGSVGDIAGVTNEQGNVLGMMPHPERATDLLSRDGQALWKSIADFAKKKRGTSDA